MDALQTQTFRNTVGSIAIANLQSIAHDNKYFYLLDGNGMLHVWKDIPAEMMKNPKFSESWIHLKAYCTQMGSTYPSAAWIHSPS